MCLNTRGRVAPNGVGRCVQVSRSVAKTRTASFFGHRLFKLQLLHGRVQEVCDVSRACNCIKFGKQCIALGFKLAFLSTFHSVFCFMVNV